MNESGYVRIIWRLTFPRCTKALIEMRGRLAETTLNLPMRCSQFVGTTKIFIRCFFMSQTSPLHFVIHQGTVVSLRRWSDTHITSSGGGGYVDPKFGGHIAAAQLSSQIVQKAEVFIKDRSGRQHAIELSDISIPLTEGSQIIAVLDDRWQGKPRILYLENVDTGMAEAPVVSTGFPQIGLAEGLGKGILWGFIACMSSLIFGYNFFMNSGWFFFSVVGIPTWLVSRSFKGSKKLSQFNASNSEFLKKIVDIAKQSGVNLTVKDPVFGPIQRIT